MSTQPLDAHISMVVLPLLLVLLLQVIPSQSQDGGTSHPCARPCQRRSRPMECSYTFDIDYYVTLHPYLCFNCPTNRTGCFAPGCITGDGLRRGLVAINRQVPGPGIDVCLGDYIKVRVNNRLATETTTIHWHGIHQRRTQVMDGVPLVTQFPIPPTGTYTYKFRAEQIGTHFYHSHSGYQKDDGVYGYLVIRQPPEEDPNSALYDRDIVGNHTMIVMDWAPQMSLEYYFGVLYDMAPMYGITVNGRGQKLDPATGQMTQTPRASFTVDWGLCYRFRIISNGFGLCPLEVSVDNHQIIVIATDGFPIQPIQVGRFHIDSGERFDIVICADQPPGAYWIKFQGLIACKMFNMSYQYAILRYSGVNSNTIPPGADNYNASGGNGVILNPSSLTFPQPNPNEITMADVNGQINDDYEILRGNPDKTLYLTMDDKRVDPTRYNVSTFPNPIVSQNGGIFTTPISNISFSFPSYPSLLDQLGTNSYCKPSLDPANKCSTDFCQCTHLEKVSRDDIVEIIFYNLGTFDATHPMHLHGYNFFVTAVGLMGPNSTLQDVIRLNEAGLIPKKTDFAIRKDTISMARKSYAVVRFRADNPGYWLLHCHISLHSEQGMIMILQVGSYFENAYPYQKLPLCGGYPRKQPPDFMLVPDMVNDTD